MKKTILCLLLALGLLLLSAAAMAVSDPDNYSFDITEGSIIIADGSTPGKVTVTYGSSQQTTAEFDPSTQQITVTGESPNNSPQLFINTEEPVSILYSVSISKKESQSPISIGDNADVTLIPNILYCDAFSRSERPGIALGSGSKLTIQANNSMYWLRLFGGESAILGPTDGETPATVILNSGEVFITTDHSGPGISGNVNLVINDGVFKANGKDINVQSLIVIDGMLWAGNTIATYLNRVKFNNIKCDKGILRFDNTEQNQDMLCVFGDLELPFDLTIPDGKTLGLHANNSLTIPEDRSLTCNALRIASSNTLTNEGTLTINHGATNVESHLSGKLINKGTLIIEKDILSISMSGTLTNTGTISGSGSITPESRRPTLQQPASLTVESIENGTVTLSAPANANATVEYSMDRTSWTETSVFTGVDLSAGQTFYARYKENNFFKASGDTSVSIYPVTLHPTADSSEVGYYIAGQGATLPKDVERENYSFAGWYADESCTGSFVTAIGAGETGAKTYWAKWTPDTYTVALNANGGTIGSGNVTGYTYGEGATLPTDVTRAGYTFAGWYDNENLTGDAVTEITKDATGEKEYWAKWRVSDYTVTLNTNGGTINSGDLNSYTYGEGATLPTDVTRPGYTFAGWYANKDLTGSPVTEIAKDATGEKEYWAKWRVVLTDPDGAVVSGDAAFAKLPPVKVPTLVLPEGVTLDSSVMLKYVKVDTTRENTAVYDVYLVDQDGNPVKLPAACTLCLPYPEGLNQNSASAYRIHILHEMDGGRSEDFDSVSGGLELTAQGLCVRISSLSPFTITWERFPEVNLPQTGDSSRLAVWLALLGACCAGLWCVSRRRG